MSLLGHWSGREAVVRLPGGELVERIPSLALSESLQASLSQGADAPLRSKIRIKPETTWWVAKNTNSRVTLPGFESVISYLTLSKLLSRSVPQCPHL